MATKANKAGKNRGEELAKSATLDDTRAGVRLILTYSGDDNAFMGTVENVTDETVPSVRVEVHLSNGIELGPTTPTDLAPGETREIALAASERSFETWRAHPEAGAQDPEHSSDRQQSERGD